jgi:GT2 family glycosyltransferase
LSLSVIVVTYNSREEIAVFLQTLSNLVRKFRISVETQITDNNSEDKTQDFLTGEASKWAELNLSLTLNSKNFGLSSELNKQIARCSGEMILICNPDIMFTEDMVQLLRYSETYPEYGIVPELLNYDGSTQKIVYRRFPTLSRILLSYTFTGRLLSRTIAKKIFDDYSYVGHEFCSPVDLIEQPGGGCLLFQKRTLKRLDPFFDPRFPVLWNDVDMAMRARAAGIRFLIAPDVKLFHGHAHSFKKLSLEQKMMLFYSSQGMLGFIEKWRLHPRIVRAILFFDSTASVVATFASHFLGKQTRRSRALGRSQGLRKALELATLRFRCSLW